MNDTTKDGWSWETSESANQTQQSTTPEQKTQPIPPGKGVFIMRAKGQSFEEFKEAVIKRLMEAGLIRD